MPTIQKNIFSENADWRLRILFHITHEIMRRNKRIMCVLIVVLLMRTKYNKSWAVPETVLYILWFKCVPLEPSRLLVSILIEIEIPNN